MYRLRLFAIWLTLTSAVVADQHVVIVVDDSGSMNQHISRGSNQRRIDAAKHALLVVMEQLPNDSRVGVLALNSSSADDWIVPLGPIDRQQLRQAIDRIQANGRTPLGAAMKTATDALLAAREENVYGDYRLLIVSDGEATDAPLVERYLPDIQQRGIVVDVIGVSMDQAHSLATRVDRYRRANDNASLVQAIQESLAEMSDDPQATDEGADFELLEGLPDGIAVAAIKALTTPENRPIGQTAAAPAADSASSSPPSTRRTLPSPPMPPSAPPARDDETSSSSVSKVAFLAVLMVIMIIFRSVMRGSSRRR